MWRRAGSQVARLVSLAQVSSLESSAGRNQAYSALISLKSRCFSGESKVNLFTSTPRSLYAPQPHLEPQPAVQRSLLARALLRLSGFHSTESRLMRAAHALYANVQAQAGDVRLLQALGVGPDFQSTHAMLCLHVWLLLVRLRAEGTDGKALAQVMYDEFQDDVEKRARAAGVKVKLSSRLTELEQQFYGSGLAYDTALRGESDLPGALLRNVYCGDAKCTASAALAARYVRRELACLAMTPSEAVMAGDLAFSADWPDGAARQEDAGTAGAPLGAAPAQGSPA